MPKRLIVHHANCPDGWGSAWLLSKHVDDAEVVAAAYGDQLPDIDGADVFLVDYCYPTEQLLELTERAASVTVLDHHQTAYGELLEAPFDLFTSMQDFQDSTISLSPFVAVLDQSHSGVGIVMQYTDHEVPFLAHVEDRDLWRFALPGTPEVFAAVTSRPYTVEAWDAMADMSLEALMSEGAAIERYRTKLIADCVNNARIELLPTGHRVWVTAAPYAIGSDVAGELAKRTPTMFAAYYVDHPTTIRFGLRSTPEGLDVAEVAEALGGGGHKHASGFEVARKWPGWQ